MKEKLRQAQEQSYDDNQEEDSDREKQGHVLNQNYVKEVQQIYQNSDLDQRAMEGGRARSAQSSIRKDELKSKIKDLKNAIAQYKVPESQDEQMRSSHGSEADEEVEQYNKQKGRKKSNMHVNQEQFRSHNEYYDTNSKGGKGDPKQKRDKSNSKQRTVKPQHNPKRSKDDQKLSSRQQVEIKQQKVVKNQNKQGRKQKPQQSFTKQSQHNRRDSSDQDGSDQSCSHRHSDESVSEEEEDEDQEESEEEDQEDEEEEEEEESEHSETEDDRESRYTQKSKKSRKNGKTVKDDQSSFNPAMSPNFFQNQTTVGSEWMNQAQIPNATGFFPGQQMIHPQAQMMMGASPPNMADMALLYQQNQLQGFQQQMMASNYVLQSQYQNLLIQSQQQQQVEQTLTLQLQSANQQIQTLSGQNQEMDKEIQHLQIMINDQRNQYEGEIKMMHRDYAIQLDELSQWKNDNMFLIDKHEALQSKFQNLKKDFDDQKDFYEKALEQRFSQMEEYEHECFELRKKLEHYETFDKDNKIKTEMAMKDKEDLKKKLENKDKETLMVSRKEEELQKKIDDLQKQLKEKEQLCEKRTEDNFNLKQIIDTQKKEIDKLKKQNETYKDQVTNKELENKQVTDDFNNYKKKHKIYQQQQDFKEQYEEVRIELLNSQTQNNQLRMELDSMNDQVFDMRSQLDELEDLKRDRDQLRRELQNMPKPQRNNENYYQGGYEQPPKKAPRFQPQQEEGYRPTNSSDRQNYQPPQQRKQSPPQNQHVNNKYNLPPSFFQDNDYTEEQVLQRAKPSQPEPRYSEKSQKPLVNDRSNNINRNAPKPIVGKPLTKEEKEKERRMEQVRNIEQSLLGLQLEQKKLVSEFDRIPENAKTMAQRRRKEELEREIKDVNKNISGMRNKLREMDALFK